MKTFSLIAALWIITGFVGLGMFAARLDYEQKDPNWFFPVACVMSVAAGPVSLGAEIGIAIYEQKKGHEK